MVLLLLLQVAIFSSAVSQTPAPAPPPTTTCFTQLTEATAPSIGETFCQSGDNVKRLLVGDFDGNGKSDLFCHIPKEHFAKMQTKINEIDEREQHLYFCDENTSDLLVADFNGDLRSDLLCVTNGDIKNIQVLLTENENGYFDASYNAGTNVNIAECQDADTTVHLADYDGDGKVDILCHKNNGDLEIAYSTGINGVFEKNTTLNICAGSNENIYFGDINKDGLSDVLCHSSTGFIIYPSPINTTNPTTWTFNRWCTMSHSFIRIADLNGDGYEDLICRDSTIEATYNVFIAANNRNGQFDYYKMSFCTRGEGQIDALDKFYVADFNRDDRSDLMCQSNQGTRSILISQCELFTE